MSALTSMVMASYRGYWQTEIQFEFLSHAILPILTLIGVLADWEDIVHRLAEPSG